MTAYSDKSRYSLYGYKRLEHKGKQIKDITSSSRYYSFIKNLPKLSGKLVNLTLEFEGRPDLISFAAYGTPAYWWLILIANNIKDASRELVAGKIIKIPEIA